MSRGPPFLNDFWGVSKNRLRWNDFAEAMQGNPYCPNELYGPQDSCGCDVLPQTLARFIFVYFHISPKAPGQFPGYLLLTSPRESSKCGSLLTQLIGVFSLPKSGGSKVPRGFVVTTH